MRGAVTGTGAGSVMTARLSCLRGIPPNRATRSFLSSRWILASKQVLGPSAVMAFAVNRAAILVTVDLCLAAKVFSIDVRAVQHKVPSRETSWASTGWAGRRGPAVHEV